MHPFPRPLVSSPTLIQQIVPCIAKPTCPRLAQVADFVRMEWLLLETLNWQVYVPTALGFLSRCLAALSADPRAAAALPRVPQEARDFRALATLLTVRGTGTVLRCCRRNRRRDSVDSVGLTGEGQ